MHNYEANEPPAALPAAAAATALLATLAAFVILRARRLRPRATNVGASLADSPGTDSPIDFDPLLPFPPRVSVDDMLARMASHADLPLEDRNCAGELLDLRQRLLRADGLLKPPSDWRNPFYQQHLLHNYLRAASGDPERAVADIRRSLSFIQETVIPGARQYESAPEATKRLWENFVPGGFVGRCKRGAPVLYLYCAQEDKGGLIAETSLALAMAREHHTTLAFWDALLAASRDAGTALDGMILVVDASCTVDSASVRRFWRAQRFGQAMAAINPGGAPPIPHGFRRTLLRNAPPALGWAASLLKRMLPEEDRAKVRVFDASARGTAAFEAALLELVDADQAPRCFGGKAAWPFSAGGDVPVGALAALRARLAAAPPDAARRGGAAPPRKEQPPQPSSWQAAQRHQQHDGEADGSCGGVEVDRLLGLARRCTVELLECVDACWAASLARAVGAKQAGCDHAKCS